MEPARDAPGEQREKALQPARLPFDVQNGVVVAQLCAICRACDRVRQAAQCIDEPAFSRLPAGPHAPLGDAVDLNFIEAGSLDGVFMSFTLELFDTPEIPEVLRECQRVLRPGGRLVVIGMSKEGPKDPLVNVFEWTHKHFPKFLDCRPIYVRQALEQAGFFNLKALTRHMWIPVEIVLGVKR